MAQAPDAQTTAAPPAASTSEKKEPGGLKDTVESILIALILAFIFRAFIVEAFIIPTGSMAPTLLGAHMRFDCRDCGYRYTRNYPAHQDGDTMHIPRFGQIRRQDGRMVDHPHTALCPNCGFQAPPHQALSPPVHYGDRILVLKYAYLLQDPRRWDVVVFKSPYQPELHQYTQNYIKRLVGLPGETVMILDGGIYVRRPGQNYWQIQTKPRIVQEALWRVVYDNDHYPQGLERPAEQIWRQPWTPRGRGQGWIQDQENPRIFRFSNMHDAATLWFDASALPPARGFTDWTAYNGLESGGNIVSDLKLTLYHERHEGDGPLRLRLSKYDHLFTVEIAPDRVRLLHKIGQEVQSVAAEADAPPRRGAVHIEFTNVDYEITLRMNGQTVLRYMYPPDVEGLLEAFERRERAPEPVVEIEAERQTASIRHLSLWRDTYYINRIGADPFWGSPERPIVLAEDEFFVLGDNSIVSGDARMWEQDIILPHEDLHTRAGRVPARFMLGKAFFVYWPGGFRPLTDNAPGIVPNFGDMRFIH